MKTEPETETETWTDQRAHECAKLWAQQKPLSTETTWNKLALRGVRGDDGGRVGSLEVGWGGTGRVEERDIG